MRKLVAFPIAVASLFSVQTAGAQVLTPPGTWIFQGTMMVRKGAPPSFPCNVTITLSVPNDGPDTHGAFPHGDGISAASIAVAPGDMRCAGIMIASNPHMVDVSQVGTATILTFGNVDLQTISSGCFGDIAIEFEDPFNLLKVNATVPANPSGTGDCTLIGSAALTSPSDVEIYF